MPSQLMQGKRGLIMGLANDKSIAWGIAQALAGAGAELAFSYQGEALKKRVDPLAASARVRHRAALRRVATWTRSMRCLRRWSARWGKLDFIVHAIGFSDKNELRGRYVDTIARQLPDVDGYFGLFLHRRGQARRGDDDRRAARCLTLTYYGAEKVMPHYNVMGVAKAALEATVRYLAEDLGKDGIRVNAISRRPDQDAGRLAASATSAIS